MAGVGGNDFVIPVPPEGAEPTATDEAERREAEKRADAMLKKIMATLKIRSRVFTEGVMIMVFPVLVAITRDNVKSKIDGSKFVRLSTPQIAGAALEFGIVQFLVICPSRSSIMNNWLCGASKILIYICVVLLMALASLIMNLIGLKSNPSYFAAMFFVAVVTTSLCYFSWQKDDLTEMTEVAFKELMGSLDLSANFSTAVTAVLFLGIEALALEGLISNDAHELKRMLAFPLGLSFSTCGLGMITMLLVSVHPLISRSAGMMAVLQTLSVLLAICVSLVVYYITAEAVKSKIAFGLLIPPCIPFIAWFVVVMMGCISSSSNTSTNSDTPEEEEVEPASLELTKITFAAFLAVTVATANETPIGNWTAMFLCSSATAIFTGLEWRLVTHWKKVPHAVARGADTANFISHLFMAFAVIALAMLAAQAVKGVGEVAT